MPGDAVSPLPSHSEFATGRVRHICNRSEMPPGRLGGGYGGLTNGQEWAFCKVQL